MLATVIGATASALPAWADTPPPPSPDAPGPAQQAGREIDVALAKLRRWLSTSADQAQSAAASASSDARAWLDARVVDLLGTPDAPRQFGVFFAARAVNAAGAPGSSSPADRATPQPPVVVQTQWIDLQAVSPRTLPTRAIVLVHGLDEPGAVWSDLAPALLSGGYTVIKLDYPNDGPIDAASKLLVSALADLKSRGVRNVDIVAHSMGGLVARDALTRSDGYAGHGGGSPSLPAVDRLVMLATPHAGSKLAALQPLSEAREQIARRIDGTHAPEAGLINSAADGKGEAAIDLARDSAFLRALNARSHPKHTRIINVIARVVPEEQERSVVSDLAGIAELVDEQASPALQRILADITSALGDGLLSVESMKLEGVENVTVSADHRSVIRKWHILEGLGLVDPRPHDPPPGVRIVLDALADDRTGETLKVAP